MFSIPASAATVLTAATPLHQVETEHGSRGSQARYPTESRVTMQQFERRFGTRAAAYERRSQAGVHGQFVQGG